MMREKCIMPWFKELTYFYMHHNMKIMLSAGNIFNPQLLFTMIWFTCNVSFQHNSNNFDTFTVICKSMVIITSMFFLNYIFNPFSSSISFYSIKFMILWILRSDIILGKILFLFSIKNRIRQPKYITSIHISSIVMLCLLDYLCIIAFDVK